MQDMVGNSFELISWVEMVVGEVGEGGGLGNTIT